MKSIFRNIRWNKNYQLPIIVKYYFTISELRLFLMVQVSCEKFTLNSIDFHLFLINIELFFSIFIFILIFVVNQFLQQNITNLLKDIIYKCKSYHISQGAHVYP